MSEISDRLQRLVEESGLSYSEIEKLTGIPKSALHNYLHGKTGKIPIDRLKALAKVLGVTPEYILGWIKDDDEVTAIRKQLREKPEMRTLLNASSKCTKEEIEALTEMIEKWKESSRG